MGKHLLTVMQEVGLSNNICFITRNYGGIHLRYRHFEIVGELMDDIYEKVQRKDEPRTIDSLKTLS